MSTSAATAFVALSAPAAAAWGVAFFAGIYLLMSNLTWGLTHWLLPTLGIGQRLDPRPVTRAQLQREWVLCAVSILIFGCGILLSWGFLRLGWAHLANTASATRIVLEIAALLLWNDVHFWVNHRLLHTRWLMRFHRWHHRSVVTTPFATYAFHPVEAAMLGSVMLPPILVHDFSLWSLVGFFSASLAINCVGHSNYDFFPHAPVKHWFGSSRKHHLHHACARGNYGFLFGFMDTIFATRLPEDAAQTQIQRYLHSRSHSP